MRLQIFRKVKKNNEWLTIRKEPRSLDENLQLAIKTDGNGSGDRCDQKKYFKDSSKVSIFRMLADNENVSLWENMSRAFHAIKKHYFIVSLSSTSIMKKKINQDNVIIFGIGFVITFSRSRAGTAI